MLTLLYRIYQTLIVLPLFLIACILTSVSVVIGCKFGNRRFWGYMPGAIWGYFIIRILFLPVKVEGREHLKKDQSYVFVANHQGAFDIFLIYGFLRRNFKWVLKHQLRSLPFIGKACEAADFVFVDKRGNSRIKATYEKARNILKGGISVVMFPEGARSFTGHMGTFRRGAFMLADELQLPIVPITINGSFDVKPRMKDLWWAYWHPLKLTIHEPIAPEGSEREEIQEVMDKAYNAVMSGLDKKYQGFVENPDQ